jgi:ATP-dependent Lon protease
MDIHVHMPEGAIPKDGPSAGITLATAIISALTGHAIYKEVGMTGEITLRGRVLPVGGVREKVLAAHRAGLKVILLPQKNQKDLVEVPKKVREALKIIPVTHMDQVVELAIAPEPSIDAPRPRHKPEEPEDNDDPQAD